MSAGNSAPEPVALSGTPTYEELVWWFGAFVASRRKPSRWRRLVAFVTRRPIRPFSAGPFTWTYEAEDVPASEWP